MIEVIKGFISTYSREFDYYSKLSELVGLKLESALNESGVRAIVSFRAKGIESLQRKLEKRDVEENHGKYKVVGDIYNDIVDLAGVRVALYFPGDIDVVSTIISEMFVELYSKTFPGARLDSAEGLYAKRFDGYHAKHYRIKLGDESRYSETPVEIQIASVLMHAWSEVEHDLVYKPMSGGASKEELMILDEINGMVIAGNIALERLQSAIVERVNGKDYTFQNHYDLAAYIAKEIGINEIINTRALYELLESLELLNRVKVEEILRVIKELLDRVSEDDDELVNHEDDGYISGYILGAILDTICQLYPDKVISLVCSGYIPFDSLRFKQDMVTFVMRYHKENDIRYAIFILGKLCTNPPSFVEPSVYNIESFEDIFEPNNSYVDFIEAHKCMSLFIDKINNIIYEDFNQNDYEQLVEHALLVGRNIVIKKA